MRAIFENSDNTIFVLCGNYYYYLNLLFFIFSVKNKKKLGNKDLFGSCFLDLSFVLKNKKNKEKKENAFGSWFFVLKNTEFGEQ